MATLSYKRLVIGGVSLGVIYVWMSLHLTSRPVLNNEPASAASDFHRMRDESHQNEMASGQPHHEAMKVEAKDTCGLSLPLSRLNAESACQIKLPFKDSCDAAARLFSGATKKCSQEKLEFCVIVDQDVRCDISGCSGAAELGYLAASSGLMRWTEHATAAGLSKEVKALIDKGGHSHYVFIRCFQKNRRKASKNRAQLLVLPPKRARPLNQSKPLTNHININVILLDSVSFYHFHRTLPKTLKTLKRIAATKTKVLSYPLFQSIKSRTFENLLALFSGEVHTGSRYVMPGTILNFGSLFKPLKAKGYNTLVMEDLCWHWEWGMSLDLLVHNKKLSRTQYWTNLWQAFSNAFIDSYGISPSSCEVLEANGKPDPFHGIPAICYNGQYHHTHFFHYLDLYHRNRVAAGTPYFSFYGSNVPHDDWGTRVRTLDKDLASHLSTVSKQADTLTIVFADHGNSYGKFPQYHQQGRNEVYHPVLYMIVPEGVQLNLGADAVRAMVSNQARLVSVVDLHFLLKYISLPAPTTADRRGLLQRIPADRTCSDLKLYQPNICICAEKVGSSLSGTELSLLAELVSGQLNKKLIEGGGGLDEMRCRVLIPISYTHPQSNRRKDGGFMVTMDVNYESPKGSIPETLLVTVLYKPVVKKGSVVIQLLAFERRSIYGIYRECGDGPATESLCICEKDKRYRYNSPENWLTPTLPHSDIVEKRESHKLDECVYIVQNYVASKGCSLYVLNLCKESTYRLTVQVIPSIPISYSNIPREGWPVKPRNVLFLLVTSFLKARPLQSVFRFHIRLL